MSDNAVVTKRRPIEVLTGKQRRFVYALPQEDWHLTNSALKAGYAVSGAHVMGSQLIRNPKILAALAEIHGPVLDRYAEEGQNITRELASLAYSRMDDVATWDKHGNVTMIPTEDMTKRQLSALKKVKQKRTVVRTENGEIITTQLEVERYDKYPALNALAKISGLLADHEAEKDMRPIVANVFFGFLRDKPEETGHEHILEPTGTDE